MSKRLKSCKLLYNSRKLWNSGTAGEATMERIEGTVTTAISYAKSIDEKAREQIRRMCSYELTKGSRVRIMPDVHAGKGCTIGTTMTITDKAVPNIVGVDIGCGMYTIALDKQPIDFARLDEAAHIVPSGMNVWPEKQADFNLQRLYCYDKLKNCLGLPAVSVPWEAGIISSRSIKPMMVDIISSSIQEAGTWENRWRRFISAWPLS